MVFLSNHYHLVVTDVSGTLPEFTEELNKLIGRALNHFHGRREHFWNSDQVSQVRLLSPATVLDKTTYALANPTKALLVSHGNKWPGVRLFRKGDYVAKKPKFFFRSKDAGGELPDTAILKLTAPPIGVDERRADDAVQKATSAREKLLRDAANAANKKFKGSAAVKIQNIYGSPRKPLPAHRLSPQIACRDPEVRIAALAAIKEFVFDHAERRKDFLSKVKKDSLDKVKSVLFPRGTYKMVKQFGARCAEA